jgi:hypothetical protein
MNSTLQAKSQITEPAQPGFAALLAKPGAAEVLTGALALLAYLGTVAFEFVYDDSVMIVGNSGIRSLRSAMQYFHRDAWAGLPVQGAATYYRPLYMLWMWANHALFGLRPAGWHAAAAVLHAVASVLVCSLAIRLTRSRPAGCAVGILFALHPSHVESVAWASGTTDPLVTIFIGAACLFYLASQRSEAGPWMAGSVVFACLALMTKETAVLLPLLLAACVLAEYEHSLRSTAKPLLMFLFLDGIYLILRSWALTGPRAVMHMTVREMILTSPVALVFYLRKLVVPWPLSVFYDFYTVHSLAEPRLGLALALLVALAALVWWWARHSSRRGLIVASCAWLLLPLLPVLNLRVFGTDQLVHDRFLYLSCFGFSLLLVVGTMDVLQRLDIAARWKAGGALVAAISLVWLGLVFVSELNWANDRLLYMHAADVSPRNSTAAMNLGVSYLTSGDFGHGVSWLERSAQLDANNDVVHFNLAQAYYEQRNLPVAAQSIRRSLNINPGRPQAWLLASQIALDSGDTSTAWAAAKTAQRLWPDGPGYHAMVGFVQWRQGDITGAEESFRQEILLHPEEQKAQVALQSLKAGKSF